MARSGLGACLRCFFSLLPLPRADRFFSPGAFLAAIGNPLFYRLRCRGGLGDE